MNGKTIGMTVGIAALCAGLGFYGGMQYQKTQRPAGFAQFRNGTMPGVGGVGTRGSGTAGAGRQMGFRPVRGEIIAQDDKSITIKQADNTSTIVLVSDNTEVSKSEAVGVTALSKGTQVAAFGTQNSDGSITAQSIQLNPVAMGTGGEQQSNPYAD